MYPVTLILFFFFPFWHLNIVKVKVKNCLLCICNGINVKMFYSILELKHLCINIAPSERTYSTVKMSYVSI